MASQDTSPERGAEENVESLRAGGKAALAQALANLERNPDDSVALLDVAYRAPRAQVVGVTGPPGVGKSTLLGALIGELRNPPNAEARSVGVIAVDPSSRRSGGALLGDRVRLATDPEDPGVFVRSMAARDRLGGLAGLTTEAMVLMRAVFDIVLIETVGVGQSETDVAGAADSVVFCIQPGSGDSLQFLKAGIVEIPHIAVVTKADMEADAQRAVADVAGALSLSAETVEGHWSVPVLSVSAAERRGVGELIRAVDAHFDWLQEGGRLFDQRRQQAANWLEDTLRERFGSEGLDLLKRETGASFGVAEMDPPFAKALCLTRQLQVTLKR